MYGSRRFTERTSLTRPMDSPEYVEFTSLLRTRKSRIRQFQCCICGILIAFFTMALIAAVSYSVTHDVIDTSPNLTDSSIQMPPNLTASLRLGFAPGSGSYTLFSNPGIHDNSNSILVTEENSPASTLSEDEYKEGLEAGSQAMNERLFADMTALASPLPSPSPASRHRYAVSTCLSVRTLALAAVGELAATRSIENTRSILVAPSAFGSFFDGGWAPPGACKQLITQNCVASKYRSFDGSCNRPMQWGGTMTPYRRLLPPSYADGIEAPRRALSGAELPSAREVSLKVHKPSPSSNPDFTVMLAVYGQFLDHDITATAISQGINGSSISCCPPSVGHPECFPVPVASGDPVFDIAGRTCMEFVRSAPAPQCKLGPRQQLNQVTAFIDGSAIYGSDITTAHGLRDFTGGRLKMQRTPDNRTLLPASMNPNDGCNRESERLRGRYCFAAGDARANENLHLTTMHLLWARQHNRIAEQLAKINPAWDDETLYEESRRIVIAQLQHVTYQEFIPIVLGEQETSMRQLRPLTSGYRQWTENPDEANIDPTIANSFAAAAFRFAHTLLPGLMKVTDNLQGTSSYVELHRMLFNPYSLYSEGGVKSSVISATENVIQMTSTHVTSQLTNHLFEDPMANATVPCGLDLVSLNIQRGRDHGLPGYTRWREYCGLGRPEDFSDLEGHLDPQTLRDISSLYVSVHDVDLYTGALAELQQAGGIVGPTFSCLIADQFVRLQKGDRFWYETPDRPHSFTEDQLQELRKTSLARLICDSSDGVTQTQAQVMRAVGPNNRMVSCEDIPVLSLEPWRDTKPTNPLMRVSLTPVNWTEFKNNITNTIRDVVTYINNTRSSAALNSDWLAFKNYINNTFSDLRNQLSELHSPKSIESPVPNKKSSMYSDNFVLQLKDPANNYQVWIKFRNDTIKSLNDSIKMMGGGPVATAKWVAFKQNVINQFADLKNQIESMKTDVDPKLLLMESEQEPSVEDCMIPAIFDWKNFKDNITSSLDEIIMDIGSTMPPPGDPLWAMFGKDIQDRYSALRDEINSHKHTVSSELATDGPDSIDDWLFYKTDVIQTINDVVKEIKDKMPPPGDPAWATYRDEIIKTFSAFRNTSSLLESAMLSTTSKNDHHGSVELSRLSNDWLEFRARINDSLTQIVQDIQSKKSTTIDPVGWIVFKDTIASDFAQLKDDIANIKAEWATESSYLKSAQDSLTQQDTSKSNYSKFAKLIIPPDEWAAFKKQINDTLMDLLSRANSTKEVDFDEIQRMFNESFADLRNEITSLRDQIVVNDSRRKTKDDWTSFQMQLNATVKELAENLQNGNKMTIGNAMKVLFQTKDELSTLEPPARVPAKEWAQYSARINETIADSLKDVRDLKSLLMKTAKPLSSSSDKPNPLPDWLMVSFFASLFHALTSLSKSQIAVRC